jgi:hypothetical protein
VLRTGFRKYGRGFPRDAVCVDHRGLSGYLVGQRRPACHFLMDRHDAGPTEQPSAGTPRETPYLRKGVLRTCESIRKPLPVMAVPGIRLAVLDVRSCKENQIG